MDELAPRQRSILRAVIVEYVSSAEPVGSELLTHKSAFGAKSATIRNELAAMADGGYLAQPHTSAGRVPSDMGYRYFVDRLMAPVEPGTEERSKMRGAAREGDMLQLMLQDTTRMLSRMTHLLTASTVVRNAELEVRTVLLSAISPSQALLVLVLANGHVENRMVECPPGLTLQDIGAINESLGRAFVGKNLRQIGKAKAPMEGMSVSERLLNQIYSTVRAVSRDLTKGVMAIEGEEFLLSQPEFKRDVTSTAELLESFRDTDLLRDALDPAESGATVTIGQENRREALQSLSIVRQTFYVGEREAGSIAVIGPTRMHYEASIPLVNFSAKALSDALTKFFG